MRFFIDRRFVILKSEKHSTNIFKKVLAGKKKNRFFA